MNINFKEGIFGDLARRASLDVTREYRTYTGEHESVPHREEPKEYSKVVNDMVFKANWGAVEKSSRKTSSKVPLKVKHFYGDVGFDPTFEDRVRRERSIKKDTLDRERILAGAEELFKKHSPEDVNYAMINREIGANPCWPRPKKLFPTIDKLYRETLKRGK